MVFVVAPSGVTTVIVALFGEETTVPESADP